MILLVSGPENVWAFAGFCGLFAGNSGREKVKKKTILKSRVPNEENRGGLAVLGDLPNKNLEI